MIYPKSRLDRPDNEPVAAEQPGHVTSAPQCRCHVSVEQAYRRAVHSWPQTLLGEALRWANGSPRNAPSSNRFSCSVQKKPDVSSALRNVWSWSYLFLQAAIIPTGMNFGIQDFMQDFGLLLWPSINFVWEENLETSVQLKCINISKYNKECCNKI